MKMLACQSKMARNNEKQNTQIRQTGNQGSKSLALSQQEATNYGQRGSATTGIKHL